MNRKQQNLFDRAKNGQVVFESIRTHHRNRSSSKTTGRGDITTLESMVPETQVKHTPGGYKRVPVLRIVQYDEIRTSHYIADDAPDNSIWLTVTERYTVELI